MTNKYTYKVKHFENRLTRFSYTLDSCSRLQINLAPTLWTFLPRLPVGSLSVISRSNISKLPIDSSKFFSHFKGYCSEFFFRRYTTITNIPRRTTKTMHPRSIKAMIPPWSWLLSCGGSVFVCVVEPMLSKSAVEGVLLSWFDDFPFCAWIQQRVDSETNVINFMVKNKVFLEPINDFKICFSWILIDWGFLHLVPNPNKISQDCTSAPGAIKFLSSLQKGSCCLDYFLRKLNPEATIKVFSSKYTAGINRCKTEETVFDIF